jgi:hypothetical protein
MRQHTLDWLTSRAREPSTWRGITAALMAFGIAVEPEQVNAVLTIGLMVISTINVMRKEGKSND